jgi:hypothetical protein
MDRLVAVRYFLHEHPVLTSVVALWVLVTLCTGLLHDVQLAGDVLLVLVRHAKQQLHGIHETFSALWRELRQ